MFKRNIRFSIAALLITVVGALATIAITRTAMNADASDYGDDLPQQVSGEVPTIEEALAE